MAIKSDELVQFLNLTGIKVYNPDCGESDLQFNIDIWAKPGSKKERICIGESGELIVYISARPIEGAANKAIKKYVSKKMGLSPSSLELIGGEKSKFKRFSVNYVFTDHKNVAYYLDKLTEIFE